MLPTMKGSQTAVFGHKELAPDQSIPMSLKRMTRGALQADRYWRARDHRSALGIATHIP